MKKIRNLIVIKEYNLNVIEKPLQIGDFLITPHSVDHSIGGACAYEIKCAGKTIVIY